MPSNTVLLVEDETDIREMLTFALERAGFVVASAESAEQALTRLDGPLPALVIIDWMLPGTSGVELARKLRNDKLTSDLPLLMLTARGEEADKLKSFDAGIDDYVTKPFSPRELIARIKALLRRSGEPENGVLELGSLKLDTMGHHVAVGADRVPMGPTEFRLLELLMRYPDRVFDRSQLLDRVWGSRGLCGRAHRGCACAAFAAGAFALRHGPNRANGARRWLPLVAASGGLIPRSSGGREGGGKEARPGGGRARSWRAGGGMRSGGACWFRHRRLGLGRDRRAGVVDRLGRRANARVPSLGAIAASGAAPKVLPLAAASRQPARLGAEIARARQKPHEGITLAAGHIGLGAGRLGGAARERRH